MVLKLDVVMRQSHSHSRLGTLYLELIIDGHILEPSVLTTTQETILTTCSCHGGAAAIRCESE